jgi:hypothetical protein
MVDGFIYVYEVEHENVLQLLSVGQGWGCRKEMVG